MVTLQVYVTTECWACHESRRLVAAVTPRFPEVVVELLEMDGRELPDPIFAVPTFVLNGRVVSLGNPTLSELSRRLQQAVAQART